MNSHSAHASHPSATRDEAANALRTARQRITAGLDAADACGWAIAIAPDSRAAQLLMLDWLLLSDQASAAATLAHSLMFAHGDDWRLAIRRADALLSLDRLDEASRIISHVLAQRPGHSRALLIEADIASRGGDHEAAVAALSRIDGRFDRDGEISRRMIDALLAAGRTIEAAAILEELGEVEPELRATVLAAQGRLLESRTLLERAIEQESDQTRQDHLLLMLIDVLERAADWPALRRWCEADELRPLPAWRLAESALGMGEIALAGRLGECASPPTLRAIHTRAALMAVNAGASNAMEPARSIREPVTPDERRDAATMPWLRALMGSTLAEQIDARSVRNAGADPALNVLEALLPHATKAIEAAIEQAGDAADARRWSEHLRQLQHVGHGHYGADILDAAVEHARSIEWALRRAA